MRCTLPALLIALISSDCAQALEPIRTISPQDTAFYDRLALSPDGTRMLVVGRRALRMWVFATGNELPCPSKKRN